MGIARGSNIITDGLIYGYDTGYGVANNAVATRFYKGKPTTNFVPSAVANGTSAMQRQGSHVETVTYSNSNEYRGRKHAHKLTITPTGSNQPYADFLGQYHKSGGSAVGDVYHVSFDYYVKKGLATPGLSVAYANGYKQPSSSPAATLATPTEVLLPDGWTRYMRKATITTAGNTHFRCGLNSNGSEFEVYIDNIKVELQADATPFVDGTRSNTDGLIDLKRTRDISVANMSFDSTGQPTFDGTDDKISTGITTALNDFSCVVVFKNNNSATWGRIVDKEYNSGFFISPRWNGNAGHVGAGIIEPSSPHGQHLSYDNTKYNYFAVTRNGGTHTIYLNGASNSASKTNGNSSALSTHEMTIGAWYDNRSSQRFTGEIPVVKLYNKQLSATEIQQDFEAYKNRFNL